MSVRGHTDRALQAPHHRPVAKTRKPNRSYGVTVFGVGVVEVWVLLAIVLAMVGLVVWLLTPRTRH
jgi:hypothetical protein